VGRQLLLLAIGTIGGVFAHPALLPFEILVMCGDTLPLKIRRKSTKFAGQSTRKGVSRRPSHR
jgi:hypothetical protein